MQLLLQKAVMMEYQGVTVSRLRLLLLLQLLWAVVVDWRKPSVPLLATICCPATRLHTPQVGVHRRPRELY